MGILDMIPTPCTEYLSGTLALTKRMSYSGPDELIVGAKNRSYYAEPTLSLAVGLTHTRIISAQLT